MSKNEFFVDFLSRFNFTWHYVRLRAQRLRAHFSTGREENLYILETAGTLLACNNVVHAFLRLNDAFFSTSMILKKKKVTFVPHQIPQTAHSSARSFADWLLNYWEAGRNALIIIPCFYHYFYYRYILFFLHCPRRSLQDWSWFF